MDSESSEQDQLLARKGNTIVAPRNENYAFCLIDFFWGAIDSEDMYNIVGEILATENPSSRGYVEPVKSEDEYRM